MPTTRISEEGLKLLRDLAREMNQPQPAVIDEALEALRRKHYFERLNRQYGALRADDEAWREELEERRFWDRTSADTPGG